MGVDVVLAARHGSAAPPVRFMSNHRSFSKASSYFAFPPHGFERLQEAVGQIAGLESVMGAKSTPSVPG
jgi:hypothetical protein